MSTAHPNPSAPDPDKVRLTWPGQAAREAAEGPAPGTARPAQARDAERPLPRRSEPLRPSTIAPIAPLDIEATSGLRRTIVEAYDRLADRLTQRLRSVHDDLDADLAALRSEMAGLRQAVDDLSDGVQMRPLHAAIDDLRSDIAGLRQVVLEWPELEQVGNDLTGLRADVAELVSRAEPTGSSEGRAASPRLELLAPVLEEISAMRSALDARPAAGGSDVSDQVLEELAGLRAEVASLRRRIVLRAGPPPDDF